MLKILNFILFRSVIIVIAVHAIIPHPHSAELTEAKHFELHQKSNSFIGKIRLVLHESDDENLDNLVIDQLGELKRLENNHKYPTVSSINSALFLINQSQQETTQSIRLNNVNGLFFVELNGLRGPPFLG